MQRDYPTLERSPQNLDRDSGVEPEFQISISHFTHVMRRYRPVILLSLAGIMLAYLIIAVAMYVFSPSERITSQPFRLDFEGAGKGEYPNKYKFNIADIINGPILFRVWQDNHLADYMPFGEFSRSVFVLESNREFERLAAEYQTRLADPKLTPVDRDRLQKEFELKAQSIEKNEYSVHFSQHRAGRSIPEMLVQKVLLDTLDDWADFAVNQQHVIAYQISVLSPEILTPSALEQSDAVAAIEVLRAKTNRVINNVARIQKLPGATLARTPTDRLSLEEIRIRLDEILRFRMEPLLSVVLHSPNLINDRTTTIRFLESQLAYDQRQLEASERIANSVRESILVYEQPASTETVTSRPAKTPEQPKGTESITPQLSDTFLDRLVTLTGRAADAKYRQDVVEEYRKAVVDTIPLRQAVAYDTRVLDEVRKPTGGSSSLNPAAVQAQIAQTRTEVGQLINKVNELFQIVSRNMTPSTQLFTLTGPPITRRLHSVSPQRLALYGFLIMLLAIPAVIVLAMLHNRVREEEAAEQYMREDRKLSSAETLP
jgi:hypothetical protein